eukprot:gnl/Spiro4/7929_TR4180_c0_g1_i2.p3 gnl/Spiro4/7929_TR4180_c0_g1~~gnl/Spiro4/7929_TR4180_c0_g1_i2.p3  ORF type:complete len:122 (-),score=7.33 gnl/Spiro4/7929_TR4180_c0_g1_i2:1065-1430(-)
MLEPLDLENPNISACLKIENSDMMSVERHEAFYEFLLDVYEGYSDTYENFLEDEACWTKELKFDNIKLDHFDAGILGAIDATEPDSWSAGKRRKDFYLFLAELLDSLTRVINNDELPWTKK